MGWRLKISSLASAALSAAVVGCGGTQDQPTEQEGANDAPTQEQGGLFDAYPRRGGNQRSNVVDDRIESNEEKVKSDPDNAQARKELTQDYYSKAASLPVGEDGKVPESGQDELRKADENYRAYLGLTSDKPETTLALLAILLYDPAGLNKPQDLQEAARVRAEVENDAQSYLLLVDAATRAGDTRTADLAGGKVVELAPKAQKKQAKQAVERTKVVAQAGAIGP